MSLSLLLGSIESGALQNYINLEVTPRAVVCIRECVDLDLLAVNRDGILTGRYGISLCVLALGRIILQQVCQHLRACQVVDRYYFITLCTEHLTESQTTDTTKTIDCNSYSHSHFLL